ncbi:MAG: c-type cytochrome [Chloroflexi bacterium]|nr:c-type cytochrome [Chloroflexota bacterium]
MSSGLFGGLQGRASAGRLAAALALFLVGASLAGCSTGAYPLDFFKEMHYAQSYKAQEPPGLSAPEQSVPVTGKGLSYTMEQARVLKIPVARSDAVLARGKNLYDLNCAVCHGAAGKGDGPMAARLTAAGYLGFYGADKPAPADLASLTGPAAGKPDGEIYQIVTLGFAGAYPSLARAREFVMPGFGKLLPEQDRWALVHYLRSLQGK